MALNTLVKAEKRPGGVILTLLVYVTVITHCFSQRRPTNECSDCVTDGSVITISEKKASRPHTYF